MPALPGSPLYVPTSMTATQATSRIARAISGASSSEVLTEAGEALQNALRWWDRYHPWHYLRKTNDPITTVIGTADYSLPSDFKHIYTARLTTNERTLSYVDPRHYDRVFWAQAQRSTPAWYTLFRLGAELKITLLPTPSEADSLVIRYNRFTRVTPAGGDTIDVPDTWVDVILHKGKELLLADRTGVEDRRNYNAEMAQRGLQRARADDIIIPDENLAMAAGWAPGYNQNHAWRYVLEAYGV